MTGSHRSLQSRDRLIVALDLPDVETARGVVGELGETVGFYKIGYHLAFRGGLDLARDLKRAGKQVFLDLKLLDIDNTVEKGVASILPLGVDMLTLHAYPKAMRAAVKAAKGSELCLLAVTVLTSMDAPDLDEAGYALPPDELVARRVKQAVEAGMGGIVCSAQEATATRRAVGPDMAVVTPGIRPVGSTADDQKRVVTPGQAIKDGASHVVVGRPVALADDPNSVARAIIAEIGAAAS